MLASLAGSNTADNTVKLPGLASAESITKKQRFADERAARFRNSRLRCMGVDKQSLDEQIRERRNMDHLEKERDRFFDEQRYLMDKHAVVLDREVQLLRRSRNVQEMSYRKAYQKPEAAREWDLNDPKRVISDLPARVGDHDPRCGTSSLQKFEGEDLDAYHRKRLQQEQMKKWAEQQTDEKVMRKWLDKDLDRQYEDRAEEVAHRTWQIEQEVKAQRRQVAMTQAEFNKAMAEQKRQEKIKSKVDNTQRNLTEINNMLRDGFLAEQDQVTARADFKGMTAEKRREVQRIQNEQREALRLRRLEEAEAAKAEEMEEQLNNRMAVTLDRQRNRERKAQLRALGQTHREQAAEALDRKKQLDELYANGIGEEYFVYGKCEDR